MTVTDTLIFQGKKKVCFENKTCYKSYQTTDKKTFRKGWFYIKKKTQYSLIIS